MSSVVLLGGGLLHLLLMLLPMPACTLVALRFGVTERTLQVLCAVAGSGLLGYATFLVYLLSASLGRGFAVVLDVVCALVLLDACRQAVEPENPVRPHLRLPAPVRRAARDAFSPNTSRVAAQGHELVAWIFFHVGPVLSLVVLVLRGRHHLSSGVPGRWVEAPEG